MIRPSVLANWCLRKLGWKIELLFFWMNTFQINGFQALEKDIPESQKMCIPTGQRKNLQLQVFYSKNFKKREGGQESVVRRKPV